MAYIKVNTHAFADVMGTLVSIIESCLKIEGMYLSPERKDSLCVIVKSFILLDECASSSFDFSTYPKIVYINKNTLHSEHKDFEKNIEKIVYELCEKGAIK